MHETFVTTRRVEFIDTDMVGIVHYSNFARFAEQAESEFFRALNLTLVGKESDGVKVGWPRVACSFNFKAPAFFEDVLEVRITIERIGVKSLTLNFEFRRGETLVATGQLKTAYCVFPPGGPMKSMEIPADAVKKFERYLAGPSTKEQKA